MMDVIGLICSAIATQEGWFGKPTNLNRLNHNPGNLRTALWRLNPQIVNGYWCAKSDAEGIGGLYHQVALNVARGYSLRKLIEAWAPAGDGDNNPHVYLENVMKWTGITDADAPLWNLLELRKLD